MINSKTILALVLLVAGALLATAVTTMVPAAYAGGDGDGNKAKAEDDSITQLTNCDDNDLDDSSLLCESNIF